MEKIVSLLKKKITRKEFIKLCGSVLGTLAVGNLFFKLSNAQEKTAGPRNSKNIKGTHDLVVVKGDDPYDLAVKAVEANGGMKRFINKNDVVLIKPNMSWDRSPEYAANTNPLIVAALVEMCFKAGAKRVNVFDRTCNASKRCYENSRVAAAAREKGANVYFADDWNTVKANFSYSSQMQGWPIYRDALECDTFISVPIVKDHRLTNLTLSMKNLMGICAGTRGLIHNNIGEKLVDLTDFIKPDLIVMDAYRVLLRNGPAGGNLEDVKLEKTVISGTDSTLIDTYACGIMNVDPVSVPYIKEAIERKFGSSDIANADIMNIEI